MSPIRKIVIIGNSAAGKSTLSEKISKVFSIPVYHLDKILWKPNWERTPEDEFVKKHDEIIQKESWIIDGVAYRSTYECRFENADLIIYLDIPPEICIQNAESRMQEDLERPNPYVNENCPYGFEFIEEQKEVIYSFHNEYRPLILDLLKKYEIKNKVIYLKDNYEIDDLLEQIQANKN